jgi:probable phosphoglycerate mutase
VILDADLVMWESAAQVIMEPGGVTSNNVAEYSGFIAVATKLRELYPGRRCIIRGDSKLVVEQVHGRWQVHAGHYVPYYHQAVLAWRELKKVSPKTRLVWIPREQNGLADKLSKQILLDAGVTFRIQPEPKR